MPVVGEDEGNELPWLVGYGCAVFIGKREGFDTGNFLPDGRDDDCVILLQRNNR